MTDKKYEKIAETAVEMNKMNASWDKITKTAKLISLPDIYIRLKGILNDQDFAMAEIAVVISQDPAITTRLLRLVNSSYYGFINKVETVGRAVNLLGAMQVEDLVLSTSVAQVFSGMSTDLMDMRRFWWHSSLCATTSRLLAILAEVPFNERLFVAGLLHDIGHLLMYQAIPELCQEAIVKSKVENRPLHEVEQEIIGFSYATVGGKLMRDWDLPASLCETTEFHVAPEHAEQFRIETALIHLGVLVTKAEEEDAILGEGVLTVSPEALSLTGLSLEQCLSVQENAVVQAKETLNAIF